MRLSCTFVSDLLAFYTFKLTMIRKIKVLLVQFDYSNVILTM